MDGAARKVAEEATEVLMAAKDDAVAGADERAATRDALTGEVADLLYHTLVVLRERGLPPSEVIARLSERHKAWRCSVDYIAQFVLPVPVLAVVPAGIQAAGVVSKSILGQSPTNLTIKGSLLRLIGYPVTIKMTVWGVDGAASVRLEGSSFGFGPIVGRNQAHRDRGVPHPPDRDSPAVVRGRSVQSAWPCADAGSLGPDPRRSVLQPTDAHRLLARPKDEVAIRDERRHG